MSPFISIATKKGGIIKVVLEETRYLESDDNGTWFHFTDGTKKYFTKTLRTFELILERLGFCRVSHEVVINLEHYNGIPETNTVELEGGKKIHITKKYIHLLLSRINLVP